MPTLLPFQFAGVAQLAGRNMLLGDQAGCGKTPMAIELSKEMSKVLVLTMASLKYQFAAEILKWLPEAKIMVINGTPAQRRIQWNTPAQYYVANYELLLKDIDEMKKL